MYIYIYCFIIELDQSNSTNQGLPAPPGNGSSTLK